MHGKAVGIFPLPECPKLALDPGQVLSEDVGRSGGHGAARLVDLGAKRPDRAAELCQAILVLEDALNAGAKPILGRSSFVPPLPLRGQLRQPQLDDRLANLVLGLEVIIDVAKRNLRFARDVGKRGGAEPVLIRQLHCRTNQPRSLIDMCPGHVCAQVSQPTECDGDGQTCQALRLASGWPRSLWPSCGAWTCRADNRCR